MFNSSAAPRTPSVDFVKILENLKLVFIDPLVELYQGVNANRLPVYHLIGAAACLQLLVLLKLDFFAARLFGVAVLYPSSNMYDLYKVFVSLLPLWGWGVVQVALRLRLTKQLTEIFLNSGLKSATGKLPSFIFDKPVDEFSRLMRVSRNGLALSQFEGAKDSLESNLQVFVDEITEDRRNGTIDIIYAHKSLTTSYIVKAFDELRRDHFTVGMGRSKPVFANLNETPHLLIAGQTGSGKSTFLRQYITSLYIRNPSYTFDLIDLKGGLEFQLFDGLPRVQVRSDVERAHDLLRMLVKKIMPDRTALMKANSCKDIEGFHKIPLKDRVIPDGVQGGGKMDRHIVVVDEAFDLFMAGGYAEANTAKETKEYAMRIAAQGRALGIHLVIATQRPDRFAVDPSTKSNLTGKIAFRLPNNASSMTVMDSSRAAELPNIKGRAAWRDTNKTLEVQTPFFSEELAEAILSGFKTKKKTTQKTGVRRRRPKETQSSISIEDY